VTWLPRKPTAGGAGRRNLVETNEVAWRLGRYQWLPNCSEERQRWMGQEHDIMFFRIDIGFGPIVCYEVDGVEVYEPPNRANDAIKRIVKFAEEVNRMPNYTADLIAVNQNGYSLHVRRTEKSGKRMIETSLVLNFDKEGKLKSDVANRYTLMSMDLPISLWVRGDEA
jgi:hypothetical protein